MVMHRPRRFSRNRREDGRVSPWISGTRVPI